MGDEPSPKPRPSALYPQCAYREADILKGLPIIDVRVGVRYRDPNGQNVTIVELSPHYRNQTITMSRKLPKTVRMTTLRALLSPAGQTAMMRLRKRFAHGRPLVAGHASQHRNVDHGLDAQ